MLILYKTSTNPYLIQDINKSLSHTRHQQKRLIITNTTQSTRAHTTHQTQQLQLAHHTLRHTQLTQSNLLRLTPTHKHTPSGTPVASSRSSPCPSSRGTACPRCLTRSTLRLTPTPHSHLHATDCRCHCAPHASSSRDNSSRSVVPSVVGADRTPSSRSLRSPHRNPTRSPADCSRPHADRHPHRTTTPPNPPSCTPPSPPRR